MERIDMTTVMAKGVVHTDDLTLWGWLQGNFDNEGETIFPKILSLATLDYRFSAVDIPRLQDWTGSIDTDFIHQRLNDVLGVEPSLIYWPPTQLCDSHMVTIRLDNGRCTFVNVPVLDMDMDGDIDFDTLTDILARHIQNPTPSI